ncbi:MAG: hypothetical protein JXX14_01280 [Deltaproteobacteria bacterium]|nr:hypothetical protein [Deltaproteobacteria bacterium]
MLTTQQIDELLQLNWRLMQTEAEIRKNAVRYLDFVKGDTDNENPWINDFEFRLEVVFYIKESLVPDLPVDEELPVVGIWNLESLKHLEHCYIGDAQDHAELEVLDKRLLTERHCWLFHCLYDHMDLSWVQILSIGEIWVRLKLELQHWDMGAPKQ